MHALGFFGEEPIDSPRQDLPLAVLSYRSFPDIHKYV
jgi:hypothetical protein